VGFVLPIIVAIIGVWIAFSIVVWATGRDTLLDTAPSGAPLGLGEEEPVSEAAVASVKFDTGLRGYRTDQVDAAFNRLAWEIGRRDEQLAVLQAKLDGTYEEPAEDVLLEDADEPFQEPSPAESDPFEADAFGLTDDDAAGADDLATDPGKDVEEPESEAAREHEGETTPRREA
jgi:DivIVA domain-containing protein